MLNLEKSVKLKSSTESEMSAPAGIQTWDFNGSSLLVTKLLPRLYKIEFTKICLNKTLKYFIVRSFLG